MINIRFYAVLLMMLGCASLRESERPLLPTAHTTVVGPFAVHASVPLAADSTVPRTLRDVEREVGEQLGATADASRADVAPVDVYILDDREKFAYFLKFHYPELPPRRAFFVADGTQRSIYAYQGERLEEDLRHEATHAVLNVAYGDLPIWLDEGLAEYFEVPSALRGVNVEHLARLKAELAAGPTTRIATLESRRTVREMSPRDYREAWAWAHLLLNGNDADRAVLKAYLSSLRDQPAGPPLSARLAQSDALKHGALRAHVDAIPTPQPDDPDVKLASAPAKTAENSPRDEDKAAANVVKAAAEEPPIARKGLFTRVREWIGF